MDAYFWPEAMRTVLRLRRRPGSINRKTATRDDRLTIVFVRGCTLAAYDEGEGRDARGEGRRCSRRGHALPCGYTYRQHGRHHATCLARVERCGPHRM